MWGLAEGSREAEVGKDSRAIWQMVDVARWMWGSGEFERMNSPKTLSLTGYEGAEMEDFPISSLR